VTEGGHIEDLLLWLLRHAKAVPDPPPGGTDHERQLAPRGRRDAAALGLRLAARDLGFGDAEQPQLLLSSTAARTTETADSVAAALGVPVDRRVRLYYGSPTDVVAEVRTVGDAVRSLMVVGHNPATHSLALELLSDDDGAGRAALSSFPTCAVALFRTGIAHWRDLAPGGATLEGFARPPYGK
jgi:phosphohistidine phosphatase